MTTEKSRDFAKELDRLRQQNAELLAALKVIDARLGRWRRDGIQAGPKGLDNDFAEIVTSLRSAIRRAEEGK